MSLAVLVLLTLAVAGVLLAALTHHHRQENHMAGPVTSQERELVERMRDDAIANSDYQGAAELGGLLGTEPTPQRPHTEVFRRGGESSLMYVRADGTVECSAELMRQILADAGWVRES